MALPIEKNPVLTSLQSGSTAAIGPSSFCRHFIDATEDLFLSKADQVAKLIYFSAVDWPETFGWLSREENPSAFAFGNVFRLVKLAHGPWKSLSAIDSACKRAVKAWNTSDWGQAVHVTTDAAEAYGYGMDAVKLIQKTGIASFTDTQLFPFETANALALIYGQTWFGIEKLEEIASADLENAKGPAEFNHRFNMISQALVDFAKAISYIALGILSSLSLIWAVAIPPVAFLALSTSATFFAIFGHFHKKLTNL